MTEENKYLQGPKRNICKLKVLLSLAAATAKLLQSCPTLCDPIDGRPPGSPIPGILQARTARPQFTNSGSNKAVFLFPKHTVAFEFISNLGQQFDLIFHFHIFFSLAKS